MITLIPTATPTAPTEHPRHAPEPAQPLAEFTPSALEAADPTLLDGYRAYLQQVGQHEMLDPEAELRLATRVQAGRAPDGSLDADALAARDELIRHNLKFAVYCANRFGRHDLEREELLSAANHGLVLAAERFLPEKEVRFSTYARWGIYSMIFTELGRRRRVVDLPRNIRETQRKIYRAEARLYQALGREATHAELAAELALPVDKVAEFRALAQFNVSTDAPVSEDGETTFGETLGDETTPGTAAQVAAHLDAELLRGHLRQLGGREALIVELRTGLADGKEWTLDEIGVHLKVSRERVRQLEERTHRKLRELVAPAAPKDN